MKTVSMKKLREIDKNLEFLYVANDSKGEKHYLSEVPISLTLKFRIELHHIAKSRGIEELKRLVDEAIQEHKDAIMESILEHVDEDEMEEKVSLKNLQYRYVVKKSKWAQGEYYAHEYDEYCPGRCRKITYSNGQVDYQVECLDTTKYVLDGVWEDHYGNGYGDHFEPFELIK